MILDRILAALNSGRAKRLKLWVALVSIPLSLVAWMATSLTIARDEPQFTLGLSWLAITLLALELLTSAQIHEEGSSGSESDSS